MSKGYVCDNCNQPMAGEPWKLSALDTAPKDLCPRCVAPYLTLATFFPTTHRFYPFPQGTAQETIGA